MTVQAKTLNERYQVYVDFSNGCGNGILINSYKHPELAEKCVVTLNAKVPGSFVEKAWCVDTQESDADRLAANA